MRTSFRLILLSYLLILVSAFSPSPSQATVHLWSRVFGDETAQLLHGLVTDASDNVLTTGYFHGEMDLGGAQLHSTGGRDIFVAKHSPKGAHIWSKSFGDSKNQYGVATAVDSQNNVIVVGGFMGTVDFGGGPLTSAGDYDVFVVKFSPSGTHLWSISFGDSEYDMPGDVAVDNSGNVFVVGQFAGALNLGGGSLTSTGRRDVFLLQLTPLGTHTWSAKYGDENHDQAWAIALDASGNPVITGDFMGSIDFGGVTLTSAGNRDVFVAKFTETGSHLWSQAYGDMKYDSPRDIDVDSTGQVLLTGHFRGSITFGPLPPLTSEGNHDVFLAKIGANGGGIWSQRFGDTSPDYGSLVAVDDNDHIYIAGYFQGSIDFGLGTLTAIEAYDTYLAKLDPYGDVYWSETFGDSSNQIATGLSIDRSHNILLAGRFNGRIDLGSGPMTGAGGYDVFIAKLLSKDMPAIIGNRVWYDTDRDGIQEAGEPGIFAVPVYLYNGNNSLVNFTLTDEDGAFSFGDLSWAKTYSLRFVPPVGYELVKQNHGDDDASDSDANPNSGFTDSFTLLRVEDSNRWDAGLMLLDVCLPPDEPVYVYEITVNAEGYTVLNFMDPNQPEQVTGYNVYRSANQQLARTNWPLVASNIIDMDEATPNKQWVDTSGDPRDWHYWVTAYNHHCPADGAEGP